MAMHRTKSLSAQAAAKLDGDERAQSSDAAEASSSPVSTPGRKSVVGSIMKRFSGKKDKEPQPKAPLIFEDTGDLEKMQVYLKNGGDVNWVFPGARALLCAELFR